jgi:hypothetical protein
MTYRGALRSGTRAPNLCVLRWGKAYRLSPDPFAR